MNCGSDDWQPINIASWVARLSSKKIKKAHLWKILCQLTLTLWIWNGLCRSRMKPKKFRIPEQLSHILPIWTQFALSEQEKVNGKLRDSGNTGKEKFFPTSQLANPLHLFYVFLLLHSLFSFSLKYETWHFHPQCNNPLFICKNKTFTHLHM